MEPDDDPIASLIGYFPISPSQEEALRNCSFAGDWGTDEDDDEYEHNGVSEEPVATAVQSTGVMMASLQETPKPHEDEHEHNCVNEEPVATAVQSTGVMMVSLPEPLTHDSPKEISTSEEYCTPPESPLSISSDAQEKVVIDLGSDTDTKSGSVIWLGSTEKVVCEPDGGVVFGESSKVVQEAGEVTASLPRGEGGKAQKEVGSGSVEVAYASESGSKKTMAVKRGPVSQVSPAKRSKLSDENQVLGESSGTEFDVFSALKTIAEHQRSLGHNTLENMDHLTPVEVAERSGITFPRPRWWPRDRGLSVNPST